MWNEEQWFVDHTVDPGLYEYYEFDPKELYFFVSESDGEPCAVITPKEYYDNNGYQFDQEMHIKGLAWFELCEGAFEPEGENPRQQLLDLGMTENVSLEIGLCG